MPQSGVKVAINENMILWQHIDKSRQYAQMRTNLTTLKNYNTPEAKAYLKRGMFHLQMASLLEVIEFQHIAERMYCK